MKQSSEMLYKFICDYCKPNVLINICLENYYDADSTPFLVKDIPLGVQLVKDEFYNKKENPKTCNDFCLYLDTSKLNTIDIFCETLTNMLPDEYHKIFKEHINTIFDKSNKNSCNSQSFYDIMKEYRLLEEQAKQNVEVKEIK